MNCLGQRYIFFRKNTSLRLFIRLWYENVGNPSTLLRENHVRDIGVVFLLIIVLYRTNQLFCYLMLIEYFLFAILRE